MITGWVTLEPLLLEEELDELLELEELLLEDELLELEELLLDDELVLPEELEPPLEELLEELLLEFTVTVVLAVVEPVALVAVSV